MFIGIDLGTSAIKTILIDENQKIIAASSESLDLSNPKNGHYEQNPEMWFDATIKCFEKLKNKNLKIFSSVKCIGISGHMHGAVLTDNNDNILRPCILWNDSRSSNECIEIERKYPIILEKSGNIAMPGFTSPKLLWIKNHEPEIFKKINKIILPKDYLRLRLTGSYYTEMSDASGTLWLDVENRKWSEDLLNIVNLEIKNMPELVESIEPTGILLKSIAEKLGLNKNVLVAAGAGDQAAGAIGAGVIKSEQSMISLGTSGVYFSPTNKFSSNTNQAVHSFCHCLPDTWHHMSVMLSATNCLNWFCKLNKITIVDALKKAEKFFKKNYKINNTPYFLPYLSGERTPHNNSNLRGAFHLLSTSTTLESMIYSIIEGISFGIKDGFNAVNSVSDKSSNIFLVGGGSKSSFWGEILATTINQEILVGRDSDFGPALGVSRLAMLATKDYKIEDVVKKIKVIREHSYSQILSSKLEERYQIWKNIVKINIPISNKLIGKSYE